MKAAIAAFLLMCGSCHAAQSNWQTVEADNGAAYKVDLNSISHYARGDADMIVYSVDGPNYNPANLRRLYFDCRGHFRDEAGPIGQIEYAPPRSVAGKMSDIACTGAKDTSLEGTLQDQTPDTPDQYCKGFSADACARIQTAVNSKPKPAYCKQGFALVGSGLSEEQLRICHVVTNEETRQKMLRSGELK
jgi:hypothetical protein